ncbi:putative Usp family protein [Streptomyces sp. NBRC 110611]|uniref:universal stress protein n=1 Tax=Streptomyces sp. NBRC 110611 TaxID=1621259 RepID=UPI00082B4DE5|nr:universal stress protein [Streptomyces sp. NBRC 110611]GAU70264.1 putative Usp family protein [Streptomyces sp. NBRC 110611]
MERPLVVGVDGSDSALRALDWAVDEAALLGLPLRVLYASAWEHFEGEVPGQARERPREQALVEAVVASAAERARGRDTAVDVTTDVAPEDAVTALLRAGHTASRLVLGSRGRGEITGLLLGSVGLAVVARARCPVVVVRGDPAGLTGTHQSVLLGVGDPDKGVDAVRFAFREAEARGCLLKAVRAWRCPAHERTATGHPGSRHERQASELIDKALAAAAGDHPEVRVRRTTVEGPAHKVLVHRAAAADLLVIGAGRRQGHFGLPLGRVVHGALCHAACPVAVVPQRD